MIRVLVVDQVRLLCTVIATVLEEKPDITVIGHATDLDEILDQIDACDLVLVNNSLANNGALELARAAVKMAPAAKVLVMGLPDAKEAILQYIETGVHGYVLRDESVEQLVAAIYAAYEETAIVSPQVAAALMSRIAQLANTCQGTPGAEAAQFVELTPRERQVLALVRQGHSNQEIAIELTIELGTVKNHIHNILRKLNVRSRHDAAAYPVWTADQALQDLMAD